MVKSNLKKRDGTKSDASSIGSDKTRRKVKSDSAPGSEAADLTIDDNWPSEDDTGDAAPVLRGELIRQMHVQQQSIFEKLEEVKVTVAATSTLTVQQCQEYIDRAVEPINKGVELNRRKLQEHDATFSDHSSRLEKLERLLLLESTKVAPEKPNSKNYARAPDPTHARISGKHPTKRQDVIDHFTDFISDLVPEDGWELIGEAEEAKSYVMAFKGNASLAAKCASKFLQLQKKSNLSGTGVWFLPSCQWVLTSPRKWFAVRWLRRHSCPPSRIMRMVSSCTCRGLKASPTNASFSIAGGTWLKSRLLMKLSHLHCSGTWKSQ